jgi:hypothetical protein
VTYPPGTPDAPDLLSTLPVPGTCTEERASLSAEVPTWPVAYAIVTFDLIEKVVPNGKRPGRKTRATSADLVAWEDCPTDWTYEECITRAERLTAQHRRLFLVRRRDANGVWQRVDAADYQRGIGEVTRRMKADAAAATARRKRRKESARAAQLAAPLWRDPEHASARVEGEGGSGQTGHATDTAPSPIDGDAGQR